MSGSRRAQAFTLIELLVVVAIIALIVSILLPSLRAAREQTRTVLCANNLRQLAVGWQYYSTEFGDMLPGNSNDFIDAPVRRDVQRFCWLGTKNGETYAAGSTMFAPSRGTIFRYMGEYLDVYKCPEDRLDDFAWQGTGQVRERVVYSYTSPTMLTGAPRDMLLRTRWADEFDASFNWQRDYNLAMNSSEPWMIVEEHEDWYLNFVNDSAWGNADRLTQRHRGQQANTAHTDGHVSTRKFPNHQQEALSLTAWKVYYELRNGQIVSAGPYLNRQNQPIRMGYLKSRHVSGIINP